MFTRAINTAHRLLCQRSAHLVRLAVRVQIGQAVEALVVLGEAAEAEAEGGDALLRQELPLLLQVRWETGRKFSCISARLSFLFAVPRRGWGNGSFAGIARTRLRIQQDFLASGLSRMVRFWTLQQLFRLSCDYNIKRKMTVKITKWHTTGRKRENVNTANKNPFFMKAQNYWVVPVASLFTATSNCTNTRQRGIPANRFLNHFSSGTQNT